MESTHVTMSGDIEQGYGTELNVNEFLITGEDTSLARVYLLISCEPNLKLCQQFHRKELIENHTNSKMPENQVERERSLVNAKILEFENLRRNPRSVPPNATLATQSPFPSSPNAFVSAQNSAPPVSSFGAIGASPNMGFGTTPSAPSNNKPFGQPNAFQMFNQSANAFGTNTSPFGNPGLFNSQPPAPAQPLGNSFGFGNSAMSPQIPSSVINMPTMLSNPFNGAEQTISNINSVDNKQKENVYVDASIWLKEKWNVGEIPEAAPPDAFCS